jgi:hypothetical protein
MVIAMYNVDEFVEHMVEDVCNYLFDLRGEAPDFTLKFDNDENVFVAKFSYGRPGYGGKIDACMHAIANVLEAIEEDGL